MMFDRFLNRPRPAYGQGRSAGSNAPVEGAEAVDQAEAASEVAAPDGAQGPAPVPQFDLGQVVCHRLFPFRGVIFDVDPQFANSEEWWHSIPEAVRPTKNQPFYHLLAENEEGNYVAYVSQQNLLPDDSGQPVSHPAVSQLFEGFDGHRYQLLRRYAQ